MRGCEINVQIFGEVLAGFFQLVLVQDYVKHFGGTLREFFSRDHLDAEIARLGFSAGFYQALEDLR